MREFFEAPWAGQHVGPFVRVLAWLVSFAGLFAAGALIYFTALEGVGTDLSLGVCAMALGALYVVLLMLYVALKGRAPSGWLPWGG
jgi:hypothetical protein